MGHDLEDYKIYDLIESEFHILPINSIDFKRHLQGNVSLMKKVIALPNGRPEKANYFWNGDIMAEIRFTITDSPFNGLMDYRKESIYYVKNDETYSEEIIKSEQSLNHLDPEDAAIALKEKRNSRESIVNKMKTFLGGVLMQVHTINLHQVALMTQDFWHLYKEDLDDFVEFGLDNWRDDMAAIDLASTPFGFLATPIDANGTTIRDYAVFSLSNA